MNIGDMNIGGNHGGGLSLDVLAPTAGFKLLTDGLFKAWAKGRDVLNCFSYTGSFSVAALRGGAAHVTNLEASAVEWETKALDASRKMADYERIRQDVARTQALYEKLLGVIQQVDVNRTLDQENVRDAGQSGEGLPFVDADRLLRQIAAGGHNGKS